MDVTAFAMCRERSIPIVVFNMKTPGHIAEVVAGTPHGTRVSV
jgi:uridylate kinase